LNFRSNFLNLNIWSSNIKSHIKNVRYNVQYDLLSNMFALFARKAFIFPLCRNLLPSFILAKRSRGFYLRKNIHPPFFFFFFFFFSILRRKIVRVSFSKGVFISALYRDSRSSLFASRRVFDKRLGGFDPRGGRERERNGEGGKGDGY